MVKSLQPFMIIQDDEMSPPFPALLWIRRITDGITRWRIEPGALVKNLAKPKYCSAERAKRVYLYIGPWKGSGWGEDGGQNLVIPWKSEKKFQFFQIFWALFWIIFPKFRKNFKIFEMFSKISTFLKKVAKNAIKTQISFFFSFSEYF